jgi:hypothetical protein
MAAAISPGAGRAYGVTRRFLDLLPTCGSQSLGLLKSRKL